VTDKPIYLRRAIDEIIIRAKPSYVIGKAPTFVGQCPIHPQIVQTLQFEESENGMVKFMCHTCHYTDDIGVPEILDKWGLSQYNLYHPREMNPVESMYIAAKGNLIQLDLESRRLHGLPWNDEVRKQYLRIINARMPWVDLLEEYWADGKEAQVQDLPF
jgi:hypothetical protein